MDWWELPIITLSGNSCHLCRRTHNAVRACRLLLHQAPTALQPLPTCVIPGMAPHIDPPLFTRLYRRLKWCWKGAVTLRQSGSSHVPAAFVHQPTTSSKKKNHQTHRGTSRPGDSFTHSERVPKTSKWFSCYGSGWSSGARTYFHTLWVTDS